MSIDEQEGRSSQHYREDEAEIRIGNPVAGAFFGLIARTGGIEHSGAAGDAQDRGSKENAANPIAGGLYRPSSCRFAHRPAFAGATSRAPPLFPSLSETTAWREAPAALSSEA
jgi:hypothetical protein